MAVAAIGEKPAIFIFDTMSLKRKKTLSYTGPENVTEYTAIAFAPGAENRTLISLVI